MEQKFCQSCGMPLNDSVMGSNADGSANDDYCKYCFNEGKFTNNFTMEEMIQYCAGMLDEYNADAKVKLTKEEAIAQMREHFPTMKRWKAQQ